MFCCIVREKVLNHCKLVEETPLIYRDRTENRLCFEWRFAVFSSLLTHCYCPPWNNFVYRYCVKLLHRGQLTCWAVILAFSAALGNTQPVCLETSMGPITDMKKFSLTVPEEHYYPHFTQKELKQKEGDWPAHHHTRNLCPRARKWTQGVLNFLSSALPTRPSLPSLCPAFPIAKVISLNLYYHSTWKPQTHE